MVVKARHAFRQGKLDVSGSNLVTSSTPLGRSGFKLMALVSLTVFPKVTARCVRFQSIDTTVVQDV